MQVVSSPVGGTSDILWGTETWQDLSQVSMAVRSHHNPGAGYSGSVQWPVVVKVSRVVVYFVMSIPLVRSQASS